MSERETTLLEPGFVLHQRPYRDSSQLLECLTAHHGRIGLVARGSRRARTGNRALLQPFMALQLSWVRRGDLGSLTAVEPHGSGAYPAQGLDGQRLLAGYYVNELVLRLSVRGDANEAVFICYSRCLADLARTEQPMVRTLRLFEFDLLQALGYGLQLERDAANGMRIDGAAWYRFEHEGGLHQVAEGAVGDVYRGADLVSLQSRALADDAGLAAARRLLGTALRAYLGERPLKTREVLKDIIARGL